MTASTPERLPVITRPNGKPYQPRKVVAHSWDNQDYQTGDCGAVVLGTHDVDRARALAEPACRDWFGTQYAICPEVGWFVNGFQGGRRMWIRDEVRGAAGVMFAAADDPEETS